jgi:hypothetical protein
VTAVESEGSRHARLCGIHASTRVGHVPASKIYSQAHVGHALARGGRMGNRLAAEQNGGSPDYGGEARGVVKLLKVDRLILKKIKSKNSEKVADPGPRAACGG